jgi:hypothetical protein
LVRLLCQIDYFLDALDDNERAELLASLDEVESDLIKAAFTPRLNFASRPLVGWFAWLITCVSGDQVSCSGLE